MRTLTMIGPFSGYIAIAINIAIAIGITFAITIAIAIDITFAIAIVTAILNCHCHSKND